ncbi:hypothetical protein N7414_30045 [Pseudomonas sp. GD04087]|uniref:hypothetical protein n=1 Tax=unclassified Pseudomonas TaxID=196821 RepID=UPI00244AA167|nr:MULTISPECIES: hypothetical protein [unclassified Pseudomonas]MDH0293382.1 hypothetical protein [Pseudomonas sp. GD04087]MDH1053023.1 hypothetical protein [Pseudomonas sp. GD03903]MDH2003585.1 hypothetical protein [Pseudomonas sp. GD03691]
MTNEISANPVAGWEVKTVPAMQALLIEFKFISTPFQRPDEAQSTPTLAVTVQQAKELIEVLKRGISVVESGGDTSPPGPRH